MSLVCDAVNGEHGGTAMLEALERANLFVVPLDDGRQWYRYHHLFADVLRARLLDEQPDNVRDLHGRASAWYEKSGELWEATRHALPGEDFPRAADLLEPANGAAPESPGGQAAGLAEGLTGGRAPLSPRAQQACRRFTLHRSGRRR